MASREMFLELEDVQDEVLDVLESDEWQPTLLSNAIGAMVSPDYPISQVPPLYKDMVRAGNDFLERWRDDDYASIALFSWADGVLQAAKTLGGE